MSHYVASVGNNYVLVEVVPPSVVSAVSRQFVCNKCLSGPKKSVWMDNEQNEYLLLADCCVILHQNRGLQYMYLIYLPT